jgi:DNA-binding MarR family transcriptional regulator
MMLSRPTTEVLAKYPGFPINGTAPKRFTARPRMSLQLTTAQALRLWHAVNLHLVRDDEPDLSARQLTILLTVYLEAPPHTVRGLAERLKVTKPVITRALDAMSKQGLLGRRRDENDRRNVLVQRTLKGALFIERLGDTIVGSAGEIGRKVA